jgi:hypothetical protein
MREDSSEVLDLPFWLEVVPEGGADGRREERLPWKDPSYGLGEEVLSIGLKPGADLSLQELQPPPRGYPLVLCPTVCPDSLETVNVVHIKFSFIYPCHRPSMRLPIQSYSLHLDCNRCWFIDAPFGQGNVKLTYY